jgi:hypothetical protein
VIIRRNRCLLCGLELEAVEHHGVQRHPVVDTCRVTMTDAWGVALTDDEAAAVAVMIDEPPAPLEPEIGTFDLHPPVEFVLDRLFDGHGFARLGGASTGKGWSSFATAQRCLYAWRKRYVDKVKPEIFGESAYRAIGTLIHTFLALFYANQINEYATITPEICRDRLLSQANPVLVNEGWRVFNAYRLYYLYDDLQPLAIEYDLKDPRTGESCRYDGIFFAPRSKPGRLAGTYLMEHKSSGRFDWDTIDGWANDGEVIGEAALWKLLGLDKRFGALRGVIVNLLGKQKEPKFHRTTIAPQSILIDSHFDDLRRWDGLLKLCKSSNNFPRSRANCINRWGRCDWYEHCATGAP